MSPISRRTLLRAAGALAGAAALPTRAEPAPERPVLLVLFFEGGFSSIFSAADAYLSGDQAGFFSVTPSNVRELGGGILIDKGTWGTLPDDVLSHMGVAGLQLGWSDHYNGPRRPFLGLAPGTSNPITFAKALGGTAPLRYAHIGVPLHVDQVESGGVFCTPVLDLLETRSLVMGTATSSTPGRKSEAAGVRAALRLSERRLARNPHSLADYGSSARGLANLLGTAPQSDLPYQDICAAYGVAPTVSSLSGMAVKCVAAELMIRAGADVVTLAVDYPDIEGGGWDSHSDGAHVKVRSEMTRIVMPTLPTLLSRMLGLAGHNVVVAVFSEFCRTGSLHGKEDGHGSTLSAPVFGKYLQNATTGRYENLGHLPVGDDSIRAYWSLLGDALRVPGRPFGPHPHAALLR